MRKIKRCFVSELGIKLIYTNDHYKRRITQNVLNVSNKSLASIYFLGSKSWKNIISNSWSIILVTNVIITYQC